MNDAVLNSRERREINAELVTFGYLQVLRVRPSLRSQRVRLKVIVSCNIPLKEYYTFPELTRITYFLETFMFLLSEACSRPWRTRPCPYRSSWPYNQRRSSCSRPVPYIRSGLCTRVCLFQNRPPGFGGRPPLFPTCSRHRLARRKTQSEGRQRPRRQLLLWMV